MIDNFQIREILAANAFALEVPSKEDETTPQFIKDSRYGGVYSHLSYMNHSCMPNSSRGSIGDVMLLHAQRDIAKGEEICIAYAGHRSEAPYDQRQSTTEVIWGFNCPCLLCQLEALDPADVRKRRAELSEQIRSFKAAHGTASVVYIPPKKVVLEAEKLAALR